MQILFAQEIVIQLQNINDTIPINILVEILYGLGLSVTHVLGYCGVALKSLDSRAKGEAVVCLAQLLGPIFSYCVTHRNGRLESFQNVHEIQKTLKILH